MSWGDVRTEGRRDLTEPLIEGSGRIKQDIWAPVFSTPARASLEMSIEIDVLDGNQSWPIAKPLFNAVWPPEIVAKLPTSCSLTPSCAYCFKLKQVKPSATSGFIAATSNGMGAECARAALEAF